MVPQIADWILDDMLVDVVSAHDGETREKLASKIRCPTCAHPYSEMTWVESAQPDVPELHCPCGEVFPLSVATRHALSSSSRIE